jgi:hypothetical protein
LLHIFSAKKYFVSCGVFFIIFPRENWLEEVQKGKETKKISISDSRRKFSKKNFLKKKLNIGLEQSTKIKFCEEKKIFSYVKRGSNVRNFTGKM